MSGASPQRSLLLIPRALRRWGGGAFAAVTAIALAAAPAPAGFILISGAPGYAPGAGGYQGGDIPNTSSETVNDNGTAVAYATRYDATGVEKGTRPLRWDALGGPRGELATLGTSASGVTNGYAYEINAGGAAAGYVDRFSGTGSNLGTRAVRWNTQTLTAQELGTLASTTGGVAFAYGNGINDAGLVVGHSRMYDAVGTDKGTRAAAWLAGTLQAIEMSSLGTDPSGVTQASAWAVNGRGVIVGQAPRYVGGVNKGFRAVRWDSPSSPATELDHLGASASGNITATAILVNDAGAAAGTSYKSDANGVNRGPRPVRWEAGGTAPTELEMLGTDANGVTGSLVVSDMNSTGTIVGSASKFSASGANLGLRPVRWWGGTDQVEELDMFGSGATDFGAALAVDDFGAAVGSLNRYAPNGDNLGSTAVYWDVDGRPVVLTDLIDPASGWINLIQARGISPHGGGWITGTGTFDPDGPGGASPYTRLFVLQIPEPSGAAILSLCGAIGLRRSRP